MIDPVKINKLILTSVFFGIIAIAGLVPHKAMAGDGDVSYSAPYITVDAATGKLITVNPGPELKMHDKMPTTSSSSYPTDPVLTTSTSPAAAVITESEQGSRTVLVIALIAAGIGVVAVLVNKFIQQK